MRSIRSSRVPFRPLRAAALVAMSVAILGTSGCHWFHGGKKDYYAMNEADRPLEFPPALNQADVDRSTGNTASGSVSRSSLSSAPATTRQVSFAVPGDRAGTYAKVGDALATIPGVTIAGRAQALSAFDVDYQGEKFLVRISDSGSDSLVAAVDPRGVPADNDAAAKLIAALKAAIVR